MENPTPSSLLISAVDAACRSAMHLKRSKKKPFTCLLLRVERDKQAYDIVPVYSTDYQKSVEAAQQQVVEWYERLFLYVIVCDGAVARDGVSSDAIVIEACEVGQGVRFQFVRRYTPPGLFSKARAEEKLTLVRLEPERPADRSDPQVDSLSLLAIDPAQSTEFVTALALADIWLLAIGQEGTKTGEGLSHDELIDRVAQNRKKLSEVGEDDSIVPFIFERSSSAIMPFFSSVEFAGHFVRTENPEIGTVYRPVRMRSGFLTSPEVAGFQIVLNLNSRFERPLTANERESLRKQITNA